MPSTHSAALRFMIASFMLNGLISSTQAQLTQFTYQGELLENNLVVDDEVDFVVDLFAAPSGGNPLAPPVQLNNMVVSDGFFSLPLDFGMVILNDGELWLEIALRRTGTPDFTPLTPRIKITQAINAVIGRRVAANGVDNAALRNESITVQDIANNNVTSAAINNSAIGVTKLDINSVQQRILGSCPDDQWIQIVTNGGLVGCQPDTGMRSFQFAGTFLASAENGASDQVFMRPTAGHICFLSRVQLRNVDNENEDLICRVRIVTGNSTYLLEAITDDGFDGDAFCEGLCLSFDATP